MAKNILVVDDDPSALEVLAESLSRRGFDVNTASGVEQALARFKELPADALITDVILPDGVGYDLITEIRRLPAGMHLPVVLMSGINKSDGEREHARRAYQALDFLIKPFPVEPLAARLRAVLHVGADETRSDKPKVDERLRGKRLEGELRPTTFSKLFCHFNQSGATGVLRMWNEDQTRQLFFVSGLPVFATSSVATENLGRHLLGIGKLGPEDYRRSLEEHEKSGKRYGETVVEMGLLTAEDLYKALRYHIREKILAAFSWQSGRYEFEFNDDFVGNVEYFDYNVYDLFLTGVRRYYDPELLSRELAKLRSLPIELSERGHEVKARLPLSEEEKKAFAQLDGRHTLASLRDEDAQMSYAALPIVYTFLLLGVLQIRSPKKTAPAPTIVDRAAEATEGTVRIRERDLINPMETGVTTDPGMGEPTDSDLSPPGASAAVSPDGFVGRVLQAWHRLRNADHLEVLDIGFAPTPGEIERAYEKRVQEFTEPRGIAVQIDEGILLKARELRERVKEAFEELSDSERLRHYATTKEAEKRERLFKAEMAYIKGKDFLSKNRYHAAEEAFRLACDLNPEDGDSYAYLAYTLYRAQGAGGGNSLRRQVLDMLESSLRRSALGGGVAHYVLARIAWDEGRVEDARKHIGNALRYNSADPDVRALLQEINLTLPGE